ncbi:hypothetical protein Tco_1327512 [Tanacetum coccineum]
MEILLEPTSNKLLVGDLRDPMWIKLVITGYRFGQVNELITQSERYCVRRSYALSWKPCQGGSSKLNLPDQSLIPAESDSLPHAHAQTTKTYYKHQDSRIKKAQELKTKTFANSDIKDTSSETNLRGRLLARFQDDAKYEHVG